MALEPVSAGGTAASIASVFRARGRRDDDGAAAPSVRVGSSVFAGGSARLNSEDPSLERLGALLKVEWPPGNPVLTRRMHAIYRQGAALGDLGASGGE